MKFDDLSELLEIDYGDRIKVFFNESRDNGFKFTQHPQEDNHVLPFLTFVGGNNREELKQIASSLDCKVFQIREAKRLNFPFEMKVRGLKFQDLKTLAEKLSQQLIEV